MIVICLLRRRGTVGCRRGVRLRHISLADGTLYVQVSILLRKLCSGVTYQFLLVDQPLVDLINVEEMIAGQDPNAVPLDEHLQADCAFILFFNPGWQRLVVRGGGSGCFLALFEIDITAGRQVVRSERGLVLLPAIASPHTPREAVHNTFRGSVTLSSACGTYAMDEQGDEGEQ